MVKVAAAQTGLRGAIMSSEQVDEFRPVGDGIWMLARSDVRQIYEGAAYRTPIHRRLTISHHQVDPADFSARRESAYASDSVMLRDTAQGYRYLTRERKPSTDLTGGSHVVPRIAGRSDRVRTLAGGVIIDPNISRPLPFAGISYVDFNLFGTGTQFNLFFGGGYAQLAFSVPSVKGVDGSSPGVPSASPPRITIVRSATDASCTQKASGSGRRSSRHGCSVR